VRQNRARIPVDPITGKYARVGVMDRGPVPQIVQLLTPRRVEPPTGWTELWSDQICRYRVAGLSIEQCAELAGTTIDILKQHFPQELANGSDMIKARITSKFIGKALEGDVACMIFYLKAQGGWREVNRHELTGANGGPIESVAVTIDAERLTPEQRQILRLAITKANKDENDDIV
jgi:hypothetical protein